MNRPARTALFLLAATAFNLAATAGIFVALLFLYGWTLGRVAPLRGALLPIVACFILAVTGAGFAYKALLKALNKRHPLGSYLGFKE